MTELTTGPAPGPPAVRLHVGDVVLAKVAAQAARGMPGVVALRGDLGQALLGIVGAVLGQEGSWLPADGVSVGGDARSVEVSVTIVTRLGHNCRDLIGSVQRDVAAAVAAYTGLDVTVSVTIAEVLLD